MPWSRRCSPSGRSLHLQTSITSPASHMHQVTGFTYASHHWIHTCIKSSDSPMHRVTGFTYASCHRLHICITSLASRMHHVTGFTHASCHRLHTRITSLTSHMLPCCCTTNISCQTTGYSLQTGIRTEAVNFCNSAYRHPSYFMELKLHLHAHRPVCWLMQPKC